MNYVKENEPYVAIYMDPKNMADRAMHCCMFIDGENVGRVIV